MPHRSVNDLIERQVPVLTSPVAIGGIGGSGTRLIAELLLHLGFYLGSDLNESNDNLWFTLLFKRIDLVSSDPPPSVSVDFAECLDVFARAMTGGAGLTLEQEQRVRALAREGRPQHTPLWLAERCASLLSALGTGRPVPARWGWKEPNTHVVLDRLQVALPAMRYVHVVRNGLDMAHSQNQNQPRFWGRLFVHALPWEPGPRYSLRYWRVMHERVLRLGGAMGDRFLMLDYDDFCRNAPAGVERLVAFLRVDPSPAEQRALHALVRPPATIGRFKRHGLGVFDPADVEYVRSLGYDTDTT